MSAKNLHDAIAVMTAWADGDDDTEFVAKVAVGIAREHPDGELGLAISLINLCGTLLIQREAERGIAPSETLQEIAQRHAAGN